MYFVSPYFPSIPIYFFNAYPPLSSNTWNTEGQEACEDLYAIQLLFSVAEGRLKIPAYTHSSAHFPLFL